MAPAFLLRPYLFRKWLCWHIMAKFGAIKWPEEVEEDNPRKTTLEVEERHPLEDNPRKTTLGDNPRAQVLGPVRTHCARSGLPGKRDLFAVLPGASSCAARRRWNYRTALCAVCGRPYGTARCGNHARCGRPHGTALRGKQKGRKTPAAEARARQGQAQAR